jgi:4-amino-4-deoxychorismate lyase
MSTPEALIDGQPGASVSVRERGLHYGDGLFETIACARGRPRLLARHLARLGRGCRCLQIPEPPALLLGAEIAQLAAGHDRSVVKLLLLRGQAQARGYAVSGRERPTRLLLRYPWPADPPLTAGGVQVRLARLRLGENPQLAGIKHCNRLEQVLARAEWTDPAIAEALLFSAGGALIGGTASNVFLVRGERLLTPALGRCGVEGVMRATVLELAQRAGIACEVAELGAEDLAAAQELFLTSALIGIRPVTRLEARPLAVGALTRALLGALAAELEGAA